MLKLIKRSTVIICICCACFFTSCTSSDLYHNGKGDKWIQEQVEKGYITKAEAELLLQQERE